MSRLHDLWISNEEHDVGPDGEPRGPESFHQRRRGRHAARGEAEGELLSGERTDGVSGLGRALRAQPLPREAFEDEVEPRDETGDEREQEGGYREAHDEALRGVQDEAYRAARPAPRRVASLRRPAMTPREAPQRGPRGAWSGRSIFAGPPLPLAAYPPAAVAIARASLGDAAWPSDAARPDGPSEPAEDALDVAEDCGCAGCSQRRAARVAADPAHLGDLEVLGASAADPAIALVDLATRPLDGTRSYGPASSVKNPPSTTKRCTDKRAHPCPVLTGIQEIAKIDGVGFEYIGGMTDPQTGKELPGIALDRATARWKVVENNRIKRRKVKITGRGADGIAAFIANMKAAGLPVEAILTMGSINCRCVGGTSRLSDHSYGDAFDLGGLRITGYPEILVANARLDAVSRKVLHRVNACLRLSFARVLDYHAGGGHWNHFHCDTHRGGARALDAGWAFVRESLGLAAGRRCDRGCVAALQKFSGKADLFKDRAALNRALSDLFRREATRA